MGFKLVDVCEILTELDSLFQSNGPVNGCLYFFHWCFTAPIDKRSNIKGFNGMIENVVGDGSGRLTKDITEHIIKFQVGDSQAVVCPFFSPVSILVSLVR